MPADIIVYAIVAAGLVLWLRNILGTRHGDERERPNPFVPDPNANNAAGQDLGAPPELSEAVGSPEEQIAALSEDKPGQYAVDNKTAETGLLDIYKADKNFDVRFFIEGAQEAFVMIVEAFAAGDRETLQDLLSKPVFEAFNGAIDQREKDEETSHTEIHAIRQAIIRDAKLQGKTAFITVQFTADETTVTRDKDGEIIAGHPDKVVEMRDVWVFGRDIKSKDPRWLVYETRSDLDDDNENIPNTDG